MALFCNFIKDMSHYDDLSNFYLIKRYAIGACNYLKIVIVVNISDSVNKNSEHIEQSLPKWLNLISDEISQKCLWLKKLQRSNVVLNNGATLGLG